VAVPATPETITGRVTSVNPKGLKLAGHEAWFNFSRYAADLVPPMRGQTVTVILDRQGYVRSVEVDRLKTAHPTAETDETLPAGRREVVITRLAVLKAASEFAAGRPQLKSGDVLKVAESWERWVNRDPDSLDLEDAL
jgi:hypothetical protein